MAQNSLYFLTQLEDKVSLLPNQMDSNMDDYLLKNLEAKVKGRVTKDGIVLKISRIINYDYGMILKNNFSGTAVYNVKYECLVCSPTKNLNIVCVIENIVKGYIIGKNGPIVIAVPYNNIDAQKFQLSNGQVIYKSNNQPIEKGNYIKVSVININNNLGEKKIMTIAKLLDLATDNDIKMYEDDQAVALNNELDDRQEFI